MEEEKESNDNRYFQKCYECNIVFRREDDVGFQFIKLIKLILNEFQYKTHFNKHTKAKERIQEGLHYRGWYVPRSTWLLNEEEEVPAEEVIVCTVLNAEKI